jgi:hypothetical protein
MVTRRMAGIKGCSVGSAASFCGRRLQTASAAERTRIWGQRERSWPARSSESVVRARAAMV